MRKKYKKTTITLIICDVIILLCFFFSYGPISYFRDLLVTTSMTTMSHKYLARTVYTDSMIEKILANNYVQEGNENTNANDIVIGDNKEQDSYDSIYEEQILKRDPAHPDYKLIELSGSTYKGYLVAIYDPARVTLGLSPDLGETGAFLRNIVTDNQAVLGINASGFLDPNEYGNGGEATGTIIHDGKIVWNGNNTGYSGGLIGFNKNNVLILTHESPQTAISNGMRDGMEFGPFLIVNGEPAIVKGNGGWGVAPRSVIAQRKDGIVLFLIIDGRQPGYSIGISMPELITVLKRYKAYNAANLDGGASSSLVIGGETYSKPCGYSATGERRIPNGWIMK